MIAPLHLGIYAAFYDLSWCGRRVYMGVRVYPLVPISILEMLRALLNGDDISYGVFW